MRVLKLNMVKRLKKYVASGLIICSIFTNAGIGMALENYSATNEYFSNNGNHVPNQTSLEVNLDFDSCIAEWGLEHSGTASPDTIMVNETSKVTFPVKIKKLPTVSLKGKVDVTVTGEYTAQINSIELILQRRSDNQWVNIQTPKLVVSNKTQIPSRVTNTFNFDFSGVNLGAIDDNNLRGVVLVNLENRGGNNQDENYHNREDFDIAENSEAALKASSLIAENGLQLSNIEIIHDNQVITLPKNVNNGDTYYFNADAKGLVKGTHDVTNTVQLFCNNSRTVNSTRTVSITVLENTTPPDDDGGTITPPVINPPPGDDGGTITPPVINPPPGDGGGNITPPVINPPPGDDGGNITPPIINPPPSGGGGTIPTTGDGDDKNNGGATPPPSEKVTPPIIKITPVRVPAGDPTITLKSFERLKEVYALLPSGKKVKLTYNTHTKIWKGSFLVPFGTKNGPYKVRIFTKNSKNIIKKYYYTITIDNSLPSIKSVITNKRNKLSIKASVLFPATRVYIKINNKTYYLTKKSTFSWGRNIYLPSYRKGKSYSIIIVASDNRGHTRKINFNYRLK